MPTISTDMNPQKLSYAPQKSEKKIIIGFCIGAACLLLLWIMLKCISATNVRKARKRYVKKEVGNKEALDV